MNEITMKVSQIIKLTHMNYIINAQYDAHHILLQMETQSCMFNNRSMYMNGSVSVVHNLCLQVNLVSKSYQCTNIFDTPKDRNKRQQVKRKPNY